MKKLTTMLLCVVLLLTACMTGCGKSNTTTEATTKAEEAVWKPTKPIDLIIPWAAGGGTDVAGRLFATYLEKYLGVKINVANVTGGTGSVGAAQVAGAKADGYTLLLSTFDFVTADVQQLAGYKIEDFDAIGSFSIQPTVYVVMAEKYKTAEDYIAAAKANPGSVTVSHNGDGGVWHQAAVIADNAMGIQTTYVPYNGSGEQLPALLGGHTDAAVISYNSVADYLISGEMVCVGTMTEDRIEAIPDCKTFKEQGYDVVYNSFRGIVAPKGLPEDVYKTLVKACDDAANDPEWLAAAKKGSIDAWHVSGADYASFLQEIRTKITEVMKQIGML